MADKDDSTLSDDFLDGELMLGEDHDDFIVDDKNDAPDGDGEEGDTEDDDLGLDDDLELDDDPEDPDFEEEEEDNEEEDPEDKAKNGNDDDEPEVYLRGLYWKEKGWIPADAEIPKTITDADLEDLRLKQTDKDIENRIKTDYADVMRAQGIDPDKVFGGKANTDELFLAHYRKLASLDYDTVVEKENDVDGLLDIMGKEYHMSRNENLDEEEVAALLEKDKAKLDEESLFNKYHGHFTSEAKRLEKKIQDETTAAKRADAEKAQADLAYINDKLNKGEFNGQKLTPEQIEQVKKAMFVKDQSYTNGKGEYRKVTLLKKKQLESADTLDGQLEMAVGMILKQDPKIEKVKQEQVGAVNILQKLAAKSNSSTTTKSRNKKTTKRRTEEEVLWVAE